MKKMLSILLIPLVLAFNVNASNNYPVQKVKRLIIEEAQQQGLSPALALAVAKVESDFNDKATSVAGARGVMQIMPRTSEQVFGVHRNRLYDAQTNIHLGVKFLSQLLNQYNQRLDIALSHYNGGSAVKQRDGTYQVIPATSAYVEKVIKYYRQFDIKDNYSPFNTLLHATSVKHESTYNYVIGEPRKNQVAAHITSKPKVESNPDNAYLSASTSAMSENKVRQIQAMPQSRNVQSSNRTGLLIKGPKVVVNNTNKNTKFDEKYDHRSFVKQALWVDAYTIEKPQLQRKEYNTAKFEKEASYMLDNRKEKVSQWESIFK